MWFTSLEEGAFEALQTVNCGWRIKYSRGRMSIWRH